MKIKSRFLLNLTAIMMAVLMLLPQMLTKVAFAATADKEVVLFEGKASAVGGWDPWQQVTEIGSFDVNDFANPFTIKIDYTGNAAPNVVMMSWSGGNDWTQISASYSSEGTAYYTYEASCTANKSNDFSKVNKILIYTGGEDVTVTKVSVVPEKTEAPTIEYKGLAGEIYNNITTGWNLGNTLDSHGDWILEGTAGSAKDFESAWGNPVTTQAMIDKVRAAGFNAVRIPITWTQHIDDNNGYAINAEWMARVKEVVDYVMKNKMYCIINVHHDASEGGWLTASQKCITEKGAKFDAVWKQIATTFKDYDNKLLFEGFNEILDENCNWNYPGKEATTAVNQLNQRFVNVVRATGGNNAKRCLVVNTYAASNNGSVLDDFVLPEDTAKDSLIGQFHFYNPYRYANVWGDWTDQTAWKDNNGKSEVDGILINVYNHFGKKGIPVIMGEISAANKDNLADRVEYADYVSKTANKYGIKCFWWDNGIYEDDKDYGYYTGMGLLDRKTLTWKYPEVVEAFTGVKIDSVPPVGDTVEPPVDSSVVLGDVNGDGKINIKDYVKLQKYLTNNSIEINKDNADLNKDGKINVTDSLLLKKMLLD